MSSRAWIDEKVEAWLSALRQGHELSIDELCAGEPAPAAPLREELQRAIDARLQTMLKTEIGHSTSPESAAPRPDIPQRIGRYRIDGVLGEGGFGRVYRGMDEELDRPVAIKVPKVGRLSRSEDIEEFRREAQALARLAHPRIVAVYHFGHSDDVPVFFVSQFIDGGSLADRLRAGRMPHNEAAALVAAVSDVLHYSHTRGFVHRDVKPSNILIDQTGSPFLADFGLALNDAQWGEGPTVVGTLAYMSPEQAGGKGHLVDGRSDIYSLGAVLYELLCGRPHCWTLNTHSGA